MSQDPENTSKPAVTPAPAPSAAPDPAPSAAPSAQPTVERKTVADKTAHDAIGGKKTDGVDVKSLPKKSQELYESAAGILENLDMDEDTKDGLKGALAYILKYLPGLFGGLNPMSFFDDMDKPDSELKDEKLKAGDEDKLKNSWRNRKPEITPAFIESLQGFSNDKASTLYACRHLEDISAEDPAVLAKALKSSQMGSSPRYKQIQSLSLLKAPIKKGTVIFVSFKPFLGEVTPCVATGGGGEFKLLYPDAKDKSENPKKVERSLFLSGTGEPTIPGGLNFKGALIPRHVTWPFVDPEFKGVTEVDAEDDTPVGKILAAPVLATQHSEDVAHYAASAEGRESRFQVTYLDKSLASLDKLYVITESAREGLEQVEKLDPEIAKKLAPKFIEVAKLYEKAIDTLSARYELSTKAFGTKLSELKLKQADMVSRAEDATSVSGEITQLEKEMAPFGTIKTGLDQHKNDKLKTIQTDSAKYDKPAEPATPEPATPAPPK